MQHATFTSQLRCWYFSPFGIRHHDSSIPSVTAEVTQAILQGDDPETGLGTWDRFDLTTELEAAVTDPIRAQ